MYAGRKSGTTRANPERVTELREKGLTVQEIARFVGVSWYSGGSRFIVHR